MTKQIVSCYSALHCFKCAFLLHILRLLYPVLVILKGTFRLSVRIVVIFVHYFGWLICLRRYNSAFNIRSSLNLYDHAPLLSFQNKTVQIELPSSVKKDESKCEAANSLLKLNFGEGHSFSMNFTMSEDKYQADVITFSYNLSDSSVFPSALSNGDFHRSQWQPKE